MKKIVSSFLIVFLSLAVAWGQSDKALVERTVAVSTIKSHIYFLASDALKGRDTPSPEQRIAAEYLRSQLMLFGVKPVPGTDDYLQPVQMRRTAPPKAGTIQLGDQVLQLKDGFLMINGSKQGIEAATEFVFVNYGLEADLKNVDLSGKIAVAVVGDGPNFNPQGAFYLGPQKRKWAQEKGAVALVEIMNARQLPWPMLVGYLHTDQVQLSEASTTGTDNFTHVWANLPAEGTKAITESKTGKATISIAPNIIEDFISYNVVGYVEGSDPTLKNEYMIYSAHYDHVGIGPADSKGDTIYNGARDNVVGTVTVLSVAENLAKHPTKRSGLFIFFTGEEKGLLGSKWYVEHPVLPLKNMVYCFNSDNAGYNDTSKATIIGLNRTTASPLIKQACLAFGLTAVDDPAPEQGLFDRSDNVHFAKKGIPAPTFSMGFSAFDEKIGQYYHQPADSPETLDYEYLYKFFQSYVLASRLIANQKERAFWTMGDSYYDAGKKLYEK